MEIMFGRTFLKPLLDLKCGPQSTKNGCAPKDLTDGGRDCLDGAPLAVPWQQQM